MPIPLKWESPLIISGSDWNNVRLYGPASYIVFKEGITYYAYGQYSGSTDYSGSNASTVIQSAINTISGSGGGKIFICKGWYDLPTGLSITQGGITIEGECQSYSGSQGQQGPILCYTGSGALFTYTGSSFHRFFGEIKNLQLQGYKLGFRGSIGIDMQGWFSDVWFDKLSIFSFNDVGIKLQANAGVGVEGKIWNIWILDSLIEGITNGYGVWMTNTESWTNNFIDRIAIVRGHYNSNINSIRVDVGYISNILIDGISVEGEKRESLYLHGGRRMIITNNRIFDCGSDSNNTYDAVHLAFTGSDLGPIAVVITDNNIANHFTDNRQRYSIFLSGSLLQAIICNNALDSGSATGTILNQSTTPREHLTIRNNRKYITENIGYTVVANGGNIVHGLATTLSHVTLFASGSIPTIYSWLPSGSAGFYVYHNATGSTGTFWKAEV